MTILYLSFQHNLVLGATYGNITFEIIWFIIYLTQNLFDLIFAVLNSK